jgi:TetR/AcrR family transcriptional repressor of nem operon
LNDARESRADSAREQILRAATRQFALTPYSQVSLDDILAEAELTKGAMYFHFRSKHALALAIIEEYAQVTRAAIGELLAHGSPGLETLIDVSYLMATQDITMDLARASLHLMEAVGRTDSLHQNRLSEWVESLSEVIGVAIQSGDVLERCDPDDISRLLVALYVGVRQVSDLDAPERFLANIQSAWLLVLPGFVHPERIGYFNKFIQRRTTVAIRKTAR